MRKPKGIASFLILILFVVAAFGPAFGHDTWLVAKQTTIEPGATVSLDLTSGMVFPKNETPIKPERIDQASFRLAGKRVDLSSRNPAPNSLELSFSPTDSGVASIWIALKPRELELTPKQVTHYFEEIDAPASVRKAWATAKRPRRWREIYTKHSKTFVGVGRHESDNSWAEPVGLTLEIVPEKNPVTLRAGDDFPVRVLKAGKPLAGFSLGIVREGNQLKAFSKTDATGRASFKLARGGRWLLRGTDLQKSSKPDADWESDFTTLTIEVRSR